jgi:hypothetical protein
VREQIEEEVRERRRVWTLLELAKDIAFDDLINMFCSCCVVVEILQPIEGLENPTSPCLVPGTG